MFDREPVRSVIRFGLAASAGRLALAGLFILAEHGTRDPEAWFLPVRLDVPGALVTHLIWSITGWPTEYTGPAQLSFMFICVITWAAIGSLLGLAIGLRRRPGG